MAAVVAGGLAVLGVVEGNTWLAVAGAAAVRRCARVPAAQPQLAGADLPRRRRQHADRLRRRGARDDRRGRGAAAWQSLAMGLLFVGIPALDTTLVMVSRRRRGISILTGGRDHLTHRTRRAVADRARRGGRARRRPGGHLGARGRGAARRVGRGRRAPSPSTSSARASRSRCSTRASRRSRRPIVSATGQPTRGDEADPPAPHVGWRCVALAPLLAVGRVPPVLLRLLRPRLWVPGALVLLGARDRRTDRGAGAPDAGRAGCSSAASAASALGAALRHLGRLDRAGGRRGQPPGCCTPR